MKPEDQRVALLQTMGWIKFWQPTGEDEGVGHWEWHRGKQNLRQPPDPLTDLNTCHEAAMWLRNTNPLQYVHYAAAITGVVARFNSDLETQYSISAHDATAAQRTEALLRTLGLWQE